MDAVHSKYRRKRSRSNSKRSRQLQSAKPQTSRQPESSSEAESDTEQPVAGRSRDKFGRFDIATESNLEEDFVVVHAQSLAQLVSGLACKVCRSENLEVTLADRKGFAFNISVKCISCNIEQQIMKSLPPL